MVTGSKPQVGHHVTDISAESARAMNFHQPLLRLDKALNLNFTRYIPRLFLFFFFSYLSLVLSSFFCFLFFLSRCWCALCVFISISVYTPPPSVNEALYYSSAVLEENVNSTGTTMGCHSSYFDQSSRAR